MGLLAEVHISESSSIVHPSGGETVWNIASQQAASGKLIGDKTPLPSERPEKS